MHALLQVWFHWVEHGGYIGIIVLMAMESSIFPVPSEIVIPPAAYWAAQGRLNFWGVILAGTFGSWLGSAVTYWIARWGGRIFITKFGRYFLLSEQKLVRAENWLHRYEAGGIFFARLLPVIRHLISIPAGIIRMNFAVFSVVTIVGSAIWCSVLAWFGKSVIGNHPGLLNDPAELAIFMKSKSLPLAAAVLVLGILYVLVMKLSAPKRPAL
jgi:membrane protein DedA with SNARE-associated domain